MIEEEGLLIADVMMEMGQLLFEEGVGSLVAKR
jgi:hypothetical protein